MEPAADELLDLESDDEREHARLRQRSREPSGDGLLGLESDDEYYAQYSLVQQLSSGEPADDEYDANFR